MHFEEVHDLRSPPNIIRTTKSRILTLARYIARTIENGIDTEGSSESLKD